MSEFQAIKNPAEARRLLKLGNPIVDIVAKKFQNFVKIKYLDIIQTHL